MKQALLFPPDLSRSDKAKRDLDQQTVHAELITIDDMPNDDMRLVAETVGLEMAVTLMQHMGGITLSIPKLGMKKVAIRVIQKQYNGSNGKRLALKLGVTERFVSQVANERGSKDD